MTALASSSVSALVPGDVDGLHALADRFASLSRGAGLAADTVHELEAAGWEGIAAEAFRARRDELPEVLDVAAAVFAAVAQALREVAVEIEDARRLARQAQQRWDEAAELTRRWQGAQPPWTALPLTLIGPGPALAADPGAADRAEAARMLGAARERVLATAERATRVLTAAADEAPDVPSWLEEAARSTALGVGEGIVDLASGVWFASPLSMVVDPVGSYRHWREQVAALAWALTEPRAAALAALDIETWRTDPFRAAGRTLPELGVGAATAGTGVGAAVSRRLADLPGTWHGANGEHLSVRRNELADAAVERAAAAEPRISQLVRDVAATLEHGLLAGLDHRLKGADSLKQKLAGEVSRADRRRTVERRLAGFRDLVRYTYVFDGDRYGDGTLHAMNSLTARDIELLESKSSWGRPGYQGINTTWWDPASNQRFEVQFHTPESLSAKQVEHPLYEMSRDRQRRRLPPDNALEQHRAGYYDDVPRPPDLGLVPEFDLPPLSPLP